MNLKNKDITEGMYVTNCKEVWKVLDWTRNYTDCLLQKIDENGNKMNSFVVAQNYELYGNIKDPQITWMNGDYCLEKNSMDAEEYFVGNYSYKESRKIKKSKLTESAKPIDEKNVSKFVDELNEWCDDNIHYKDEESAHFTKEYGKLYNFKYDLDYSFGDKGDWLVYDIQGTLDWYDDNLVVPFIKKLAKKYGWYAEPCHSYSDFMLGEI